MYMTYSNRLVWPQQWHTQTRCADGLLLLHICSVDYLYMPAVVNCEVGSTHSSRPWRGSIQYGIFMAHEVFFKSAHEVQTEYSKIPYNTELRRRTTSSSLLHIHTHAFQNRISPNMSIHQRRTRCKKQQFETAKVYSFNGENARISTRDTVFPCLLFFCMRFRSAPLHPR